MPVFYSPHADLILAALSIAQLIAGVTCICISREVDASRKLHSWKWIGIGLCISALRDWVGIIGISYGNVLFYHAATFFLAGSGLCFAQAARVELAETRARPSLPLRFVALALGLILSIQIVEFSFGLELHQSAQVKATKYLFFLSVLCLYFASRTREETLSHGYRLVLIVLALYAGTLVITLPPGASETPVNLFWNMIHGILYCIRLLFAFSLAAMAWNLYGRIAGARGWIRLWPLAVIILQVMTGGAAIIIVADNYALVVKEEFLETARNAAAITPPDKVRAAAARLPDAADNALQVVRQLSVSLGYGKIRPRIDLLVPELGNFTGRLVIGTPDSTVHPPDSKTLTGMNQLSGPDVLFYYSPDMRDPVAAAPIINEADMVVGTVIVTMSAVEMVRDLYGFKRPLLLLMPVAFLVFLLLFRGQQRAWLASHSSNWAEALKTGALANTLASVAITRNSRILDVNHRACEILAVSPDQLIGKNITDALEFFRDEDKAMVHQVRKTLAQDGKAFFEIALRVPGGQPVHLMAFARVIGNDAKEGTTVIWETVDISLLKHMEAEVRHSRDHLQMVIDTMPVAIFVKNTDGRYSMANTLFAKLFGKKNAAAVLGVTSAEISEEMHPAAVYSDAKCIELNGEPYVYELGLTVDGKRKYFEIAKTLKWLGNDRKKYTIVGTIHDFTTRKTMEDAIHGERHFLMQLINAMPVIICFVAPDRTIRLCNTAFAREAGVEDPNELIGHSYDDVAPLGPVDMDVEKHMLEVGHGMTDMDIELDRDGNTRQFMLRRIALSSESGVVLGLLKVFWETTDLVTANRAALAAARAKSAFLATMSHELRTPMNGIIGMTSLLMEQATPEQRLSADIIAKSAKTLQMVVDEVMDIASMDEDAARFAIRVEPFALLPAVEETIRIESSIIEAWGADLLLHYDYRLPTAFYGDARRIRQILVQIISHVARTSPYAPITLTIRDAGKSMLSLAVRFIPTDGTTAESLEKIFLASAEAGADTALMEELGMLKARVGLPLTWRLIQAMRGALRVTEDDGGVVCEVLLPLEPYPSAPALRPDLSGHHVLVAANADRAAAALPALQFAGAIADAIDIPGAVADKAIAAARRGDPYSLVLLDATFIHQDQVPELLLSLSSPDANAPAVVVMAQNKDVESVLAVFHSRVDSYITYPLCPSEIWEKADPAGRTGAPRRKNTTRPNHTRVILAPDESLQPRQTRSADGKTTSSVLLVEDNTVNQTVQLGMLNRLGCTSQLARNGQEALDMVLAGNHYDIILMDCNMPLVDGYEATSRIRLYERSNAEVKRHTIVALTANSVAGDMEKCLASGMDDYLAKPVTLEAIRAILRKHGVGQGNL